MGENDALREAAAIGWDACVAAMRYEDGSPVEVVTVVNPYRSAPVERIEGAPVWGRTNGFHAPVRIHPSEDSARAAAADPCKGGRVVVFRSAENGWEDA